MPAELPPFSSVLKSRDVEDPVNLWVHRPLAYAFVALIFRTSITPNQVTLLATLVGVAAAPCFIHGSTGSMIAAGILVWLSAILDGADGILARAKSLQSEMGRALDGSADFVVALAVLSAATFHLWEKHHDPTLLLVVLVVFIFSIFHVYMYDYYKEAFLMMTRPNWDGRPETRAAMVERLKRLQREKAPWVQIFAAKLYVDLITNQKFVVERTNQAALREGKQFAVTPEAIEIYRRHNRGPMRLWIWVSSAPHCYLISIFAMLDRVNLYVWLRLIVINLIFVIVMVWQRIASQRTLRDLEASGLAPVAA